MVKLHLSLKKKVELMLKITEGAITKSWSIIWMIRNVFVKLNLLIWLQTHFDVAQPIPLINTLQHRPTARVSDEGIDESQALSVHRCLQQPWRLWAVMIFRIAILFGFAVTAEGRENGHKGACVWIWQLSISGMRVILWTGGAVATGRRRPSTLPLSLFFFIYSLSLSPCLVIALSLPFYSPHSLLRFTWITCLI